MAVWIIRTAIIFLICSLRLSLLMKKSLLFIFLFFFCIAAPLLGQSDSPTSLNFHFLDRFKIKPPEDFRVYDTPNDNGGSLSLKWQLSPSDNLWGKRGFVEKYLIERRVAGEKHYILINTATSQSRSAFDNSVNNKSEYEYRLAAYPFKSVFRPAPWNSIMLVDQVEKLKVMSPFLNLHPSGVIISLLSQNYDYYADLNGYKSPLATKSIWQNFNPGPPLEGPAGIGPSWLSGQLLSGFAPYMLFFVQSAETQNPYELMTLGQYLGDSLMAFTSMAGPVKAKKSWLNMSRVNVLILMVILCFFILYYIARARAGAKLFIRKIAGLDAVEEAVGRATEMGKEIFYIPGTQDMENIQTIAGVIILGRVARLTAELETKLEVPVSRSLVMVTAREIVKEAYINAGRPEAFNEDMVHYLTDDQFGYAAAIDGKMVRQKPATIFYMGAFYAESLILAETGNSIGAIQIAGTAMPAQLPFFVAACDYTLIGEELFAASAYLSREPKLLGSLKGQDIGKALLLVALAIGVIVQTFGWFDFASLFSL
jgi:hypothetical protein